MKTYLLLFRGINVGGKNKIRMVELKECLEKAGFENVVTYIQSGNAIVQSQLGAKEVADKIEKVLPKQFKLDSELIKVLVLTHKQLQSIVDERPKGFGDDPKKYYSDAIFLIDIPSAKAMAVFNPREGVDKVWEGKNVIYSQRLGTLRTKSRLSKIAASPLYKSMTIRSWTTTMKLLNLLEQSLT